MHEQCEPDPTGLKTYDTRINSVLQTIGSLTQLPNLSIIIILKPETRKLEPDILKKNVFQMT